MKRNSRIVLIQLNFRLILRGMGRKRNHRDEESVDRLNRGGVDFQNQHEAGPCPLCGRVMVIGKSVNEHHLLPKMYGGTEKFFMHRICHGKIHATLSEKELRDFYHTFDRLRSHPDLQKFIRWVRKRPLEFNVRHVKSQSL